MSTAIPVVIFAYARPAHLRRALACLRDNGVPQIEAFADAPRGDTDAAAVAEVRSLLRKIDWCDVHLTERPVNFGLGRNVLAGVTEIAARHEAFIVWEDDLVAVRGTYAWLSAALRHYATAPQVMSITAWTHPRVTPRDVGHSPYCDARAECWVWATWARSWRGMPEASAREKMRMVADPAAYGADLPQMAEVETEKNIWAVRWLYHHLQHGGLCVRPPWSMVEHIGFDATATNAQGATAWANPPLRTAPPIPDHWPAPREHPDCRRLWQKATAPGWRALLHRMRRRLLAA